MPTIDCNDRVGVVTVHGVDYRIVDIGMRMLTVRERFAAQGFPPDYIIDVEVPVRHGHGWRMKKISGEAQGRIIVSSPDSAAVERIARAHGVPARRLGVVEPADRPFRIRLARGELVAPIGALATAYHGAIPAIMTRVAVADDAAAPEYSSTVGS